MGKGVDPLSMGFSAITGLAGMEAQRKAAGEAASFGRMQRELMKRGISVFDKAMAAFDAHKASGAFDPNMQIAQLEKDTAGYEARDAGGVASAATRMGYQPGDTIPERNLARVKLNYRQFLDSMRMQLRRQSVMDEMGALGSINTSGVMGGAQLAGQGREAALAHAPNPGGFLQAMMPFLRPKGTTPSTSPAAPARASSLGTGGYMNYRPSVWDHMPAPGKRKLAVSYGF